MADYCKVQPNIDNLKIPLSATPLAEQEPTYDGAEVGWFSDNKTTIVIGFLIVVIIALIFYIYWGDNSKEKLPNKVLIPNQALGSPKENPREQEQEQEQKQKQDDEMKELLRSASKTENNTVEESNKPQPSSENTVNSPNRTTSELEQEVNKALNEEALEFPDDIQLDKIDAALD